MMVMVMMMMVMVMDRLLGRLFLLLGRGGFLLFGRWRFTARAA
jgi:hypothetical protein